jgi:hypothetical protein
MPAQSQSLTRAEWHETLGWMRQAASIRGRMPMAAVLRVHTGPSSKNRFWLASIVAPTFETGAPFGGERGGIALESSAPRPRPMQVIGGSTKLHTCDQTAEPQSLHSSRSKLVQRLRRQPLAFHAQGSEAREAHGSSSLACPGADQVILSSSSAARSAAYSARFFIDVNAERLESLIPPSPGLCCAGPQPKDSTKDSGSRPMSASYTSNAEVRLQTQHPLMNQLSVDTDVLFCTTSADHHSLTRHTAVDQI